MNTIVVRLGALASHIPYSLIPGVCGVYNRYSRQIYEYDKSDNKKDWIFKKTYRMVEYAINNIPFYKDLYEREGFSLGQLRSFEDIEKIPIVTKKDLMAVPLEKRSLRVKYRYIANTGGSTGVPLSFYKTKQLKVKETVFHNIGKSSIGYCQSDVRLFFIGRSKSNSLGYDLTRNRLLANIYIPFDQILKEIANITKFTKVRYIQGYPSVLYEFALYIEAHPQEYKLSGLKGQINGIFFNSEYPYPEFRKKIEEVFAAKSVASYGHTEGCVIAFDDENHIYHVNQAYGYAESKEINGELHLIGTCYDNFASPFIKYDTGDVIDEVVYDNGVLDSFKMTKGGRSGQYIFDKNGKRISLTGFIFGRHHQLFNYCKQIQISQTSPGLSTIYYVAKEGDLRGKKPEELFDNSEINMDIKFKRIEEPIRTKSGKMLLLVKENINKE